MHCILEPRQSGAEMLVVALVRSQLKAKAAVAVVAFRPSAVAFESEVVELSALGCEIYLPAVPLEGFARALWVRNAAKNFGADVVFAHSLLPSVYSRLALVGRATCKLVTVLHADDDFADIKARLFERASWRLSAAVVGVSAASLSNYHRHVTSKQKTLLIANGVVSAPIRAAATFRQEVRESIYGVSSGDVVVLQLGRISEQKQQLLSVEAFAKLTKAESARKALLVFAGLVESEAYYNRVANAARSLDISDKVRFLGSRRDVAKLLAGADIHLMPSAWEAQGIAALEALAAGVFCIFSHLDAFLPYQTMSGVSLLPKDSSTEQAATALKTAVELGAATKRFERDLRRFDFDKCALAYMSLAKSLHLLNHPPGR